jgi:hypothetical protein
MQEISELGYFIIRNIEDNALDGRVGVGKNKHPQIYFIPNNKESQVREANEAELNTTKDKVDQWLNKYDAQVRNLFT